MDAMSGYGASHWVGLGTISEFLGLPGKSFLEEGHVWENLERGREDLVDEYCKLDVVSDDARLPRLGVSSGEDDPSRSCAGTFRR